MKKTLAIIVFMILLSPRSVLAVSILEETKLLHERIDNSNARITNLESTTTLVSELQTRVDGLETYAINALSNSMNSVRTFTVMALVLLAMTLGLLVISSGLVVYHKILNGLDKRLREKLDILVKEKAKVYRPSKSVLAENSQFSNKLHTFPVNAEEDEDGAVRIIVDTDKSHREKIISAAERQTTLSIFNLSEPLA